MDDFISREAALEVAWHNYYPSIDHYCTSVKCATRKDLEAIPAADVVERKKSKWEWSSAYGYYFCPECHSISPREDQDGNCIDCPNFCCECGADMRGES